MKNIILIDAPGEWVETILGLNINISLIITNQTSNIKKKFGNVIENIFPRDVKNKEFNSVYFSNYNLSYEELEKYRSTQIKVEHYLRRFLVNDGLIQYYYHMALAYWLDFFSKKSIDMVFLGTVEHGAFWDSILIDIAKNLNIPIFIISYSAGVSISGDNGNEDIDIKHIVHYNSLNFIDLSNIENIKRDEDKASIEKYIHLLKHTHNKSSSSKIIFKSPIKYYFNTRIKTLFSTWLYYLSTSMIKYNIENKKDSFMHLSKREILKQSSFIDLLRKVYCNISRKFNLSGEKYIYYPLHLDPEASIMARSILTSQIFIIQWISSVLPKDWKLLVKEHPHQFFIYERHRFYLKNINYYRDFSFYSQIKDLPNVEFVDINISSKELIEKSQAIASICGSSLIEGIAYKKPILVFGKSLSFVELLQDSFVIKDREGLRYAIEKIKNGFTPQYSDLELIINKYTFLKNSRAFDNKDFFSSIFKYLLSIKF